MHMDRIPTLKIGNLEINPPIIQGGMGVRVSGANLASTVANTRAYLDAKPEDLTIIKSPVRLPGRVIKNAFVEKVKQGQTMPFKCSYKCLKTCDPKKAAYCIAKVLANAAQ